MATPGSTRRFPKRWVEDHEVLRCPLCSTRFDSSIFDLTTSRRTHCRYCGRVFCTNCCREELYMPEDEVVAPPPSALKSIIFDKTQKQKACRNCVKILLPQQEAIKAARGRGLSRSASFAVRRNPGVSNEPYYTIVIVRAREKAHEAILNVKKGASVGMQLLANVGAKTQSLRGISSVVSNPVCLLTVGNTSSITQPTQSGPNPVWDQPFDFTRKVLNEFGNQLKLTCYEDEHGGKVPIGEGSTKVMETGHAGAWVPITDNRKAVTGEVLLRCSYRGPRTTKPSIPPARGLPSLSGHGTEVDEDLEESMPVLHWLQDKAWLIYVVLLLISILYRFANSGSFVGDPITLRPGTPTGNNVSKRSETHYITLQKDGNLVLREGKPGDPRQTEPVWQSGKPFGNKDCPKCVFMVDSKGEKLVVKNGRKILKSFDLPDDEILSLAIKTR